MLESHKIIKAGRHLWKSPGLTLL